MNFIIYPVVILLILQSGCEGSPVISQVSQQQIKNIGDTVNLTCSVQHGQDYPVLWIKIDKETHDHLPISSGTSLILRDKRFLVQYDNATSTYKLQIKEIQEADTGLYQCQILVSLNDRISADIELQVRRTPIINDNSTREVITSEGKTVQLDCYADGFPYPSIFWRRENSGILPMGGTVYRGSSLVISKIRKEDRGTYYCFAENGIGEVAKHAANVDVEFAPVVSAPKPRLGQALQYDTDLTCHVEAYPSPVIAWYKDNMQLSSDHYKISQSATSISFTESTIRVANIKKEQYGQYTCRATNKLGSTDTKIELFETTIPVCPPACG